MTPNIASPVFNTLVAAFFVVILLGIALAAYAASQVKKAQKRAEAVRARSRGRRPPPPRTPPSRTDAALTAAARTCEGPPGAPGGPSSRPRGSSMPAARGRRRANHRGGYVVDGRTRRLRSSGGPTMDRHPRSTAATPLAAALAAALLLAAASMSGCSALGLRRSVGRPQPTSRRAPAGRSPPRRRGAAAELRRHPGQAGARPAPGREGAPSQARRLDFRRRGPHGRARRDAARAA